MGLVVSRIIRAIVLVVALGLGGIAGVPTMGLPPARGVSITGLDDDPDHGGGGGGDGPNDPDGPRVPGRQADRDDAADRCSRTHRPAAWI